MGTACFERTVSTLGALLLVACGNAGESGPGQARRDSPIPHVITSTDASIAGPTLSTEPISLEPGGERLFVCQSFALHNEETEFVHGVTFSATGVHHSTWSVVPEGAYDGPDGSADCEAFGFTLFAEQGPVKDAVLFSQSPEAASETQIFPDGAAFAVAPHSKIFVSYHVLNTSSDPVDVGMSAALRLLALADVTTRLTSGGAMTELLALPPGSRSRFSSACTFAAAPEFKAYFILPHYHQYGTGMRLELVGGARDGEVVWQNEGAIGEALGARLDPPVDFTGANGFRFSCAYENPTAQTITGGSASNQEMCGFYVSTDAPSEFYGVATPGFATPTLVDGGVSADGVQAFDIDGCNMLMP